MRLPKSHPFISALQKAEALERGFGTITDEVLEIRRWAKEKYPELFDAYIQAKASRQKPEWLKKKEKREERKSEKVKRSKRIAWFLKNSLGAGRGTHDH